MKTLRIIVVIIFLLMIFLPLVTLNVEPQVESSIDNRMLAENPFKAGRKKQPNEKLNENIENYIKDRIGFRDRMICWNNVINDRLFHKMVHPTYDYGKDGYIFFKYEQPPEFSDYHIAFADMILNVQNYCHERNVPFVFVFNPEKITIYPEYIPDGVTYHSTWEEDFLHELDIRDINYIDNTSLMLAKKENGEQVFNRKYNAGHWNDLGAYYGVNNIIQNLQQFFPDLTLNQKEDFNITTIHQDTLMVSQFPISEDEPCFLYKGKIQELTSLYEQELKTDPQYPFFYYTYNKEKDIPGNPKILSFQGSYMNGMGHKFMSSAFSEYIAVHDYQNIINFPYYFNLFQPDCVVFEVAEYTLNSNYFDYSNMQSIYWNPTLHDYTLGNTDEIHLLNWETGVSVEKGDEFTVIQWDSEIPYDYVWFWTGHEFDMAEIDKTRNIYEVTVPNDFLDDYDAEKYILAGADGLIYPYEITYIQ